MARCSKCGAEADESVRFCPACGRKFIAVAPPVSAGEDGLYYCAKHKRTPTRVTCGRCEKPICDRCMVVGANGVRCRDCARYTVPLSLPGMIHDIGASISGATRGIGGRWIWYLFISFFIFRFLLGCFWR